MIGKIDKAKRYAEERERISFKKFEVTFRGDNNLHTTRLRAHHGHGDRAGRYVTSTC